ncbi:oligosaccharide flippase family protein, partial [Thermanaerothrix sp.]|uniref:oligosaccharide flippase family protein n=1 Tax=Thermanaerothrix sp. TaxID=2972675 RepID=UPI003C7BDA9F
PIILFAGLSLRAVQATDARRVYQFGDYLALRIASTSLAFLIIIGIAWGGHYNVETKLIILFIGLAKSFEAISDIFYGLFQQYERMDYSARSMVIKGLLSLVALTFAMLLTHWLWAGAAALAMAWLTVLILYDIPQGTRLLSFSRRTTLQLRWHLPTLMKLIQLAFPLGLTMMLISLNTNIPRYFIERYWGHRELGFFAAMAYFIVAGTAVVSALGQSASPRLAKYYAFGKKQEFLLLLLKLAGIGVALGICGVIISLTAGPEILAFLYRLEYTQYSNVLIWIMVAAMLGYVASFMGYAMTAAHYFLIQPFIFGFVALINAWACFFLVPTYGALGGAWSLVVANMMQLILTFICVIVALGRMPKVAFGEEERL